MIMNLTKQLQDAINMFGPMTDEQLIEKMLLRYPNERYTIDMGINNAIRMERLKRIKQLDGSLLLKKG